MFNIFVNLLHATKSPLPLYNGTITADLQSSGIKPLSKAIFHKFQITLVTVSPSTLYHFSNNLIFTCCLSISKLYYFYIQFRHWNNYLFEYHQSHTCGLQPTLEYLYHIDPWDNPSISFILHHLPLPSFILLQLSTFPPFTLLTSFQNNFLFPSTLWLPSFQTVPLYPLCFDI